MDRLPAAPELLRLTLRPNAGRMRSDKLLPIGCWPPTCSLATLPPPPPRKTRCSTDATDGLRVTVNVLPRSDGSADDWRVTDRRSGRLDGTLHSTVFFRSSFSISFSMIELEPKQSAFGTTQCPNTSSIDCKYRNFKVVETRAYAERFWKDLMSHYY